VLYNLQQKISFLLKASKGKRMSKKKT